MYDLNLPPSNFAMSSAWVVIFWSFATRFAFAALARHSDSFWLYAADPDVSVWPSIATDELPPDFRDYTV